MLNCGLILELQKTAHENCPKENPYARLANKGSEYTVHPLFQNSKEKKKTYNKNQKKKIKGRREHAENSRKKKCLKKSYVLQGPELQFKSKQAL